MSLFALLVSARSVQYDEKGLWHEFWNPWVSKCNSDQVGNLFFDTLRKQGMPPSKDHDSDVMIVMWTKVCVCVCVCVCVDQTDCQTFWQKSRTAYMSEDETLAHWLRSNDALPTTTPAPMETATG